MLFNARCIVHSYNFDLIYWRGMDRVIKSFPGMFRVFITKQVSHFCATNKMLSIIDGKIKNQCPNCRCPNETTTHITRCLDPGRSACFEKLVESIRDWLKTNNTGDELILCIIKYLLTRSRSTMSAITWNKPAFHSLATHHDRLGWDCFLEGRICWKWVEIQHQEIEANNMKTTAESWARGLMSRLLQLTHSQWIYRNQTVRFMYNGLTSTQHDEIIKRMEELLDTDSDDLLLGHRLLLTYDFEEMGEAPPSERQYWIAEMDAATSVADKVCDGAEQLIHSRQSKEQNI